MPARPSLTSTQVLDLLRRYVAGATQHELADRFGVAQTVVAGIVLGQRYKWVERPLVLQRKLDRVKRKPRHRVTSDERRRMRAMRREGATFAQIAQAFGVHVSTAHAAATRRDPQAAREGRPRRRTSSSR